MWIGRNENISAARGLGREVNAQRSVFRGRGCVFSSVSVLFEDWQRGRSGEGADEKNEPPALILGQAFFERGHRFSAFADLVEDFAVSDGVHVPGVGEVGTSHKMHPLSLPVALAVFAVALR